MLFVGVRVSPLAPDKVVAGCFFELPGFTPFPGFSRPVTTTL